MMFCDVMSCDVKRCRVVLYDVMGCDGMYIYNAVMGWGAMRGDGM